MKATYPNLYDNYELKLSSKTFATISPIFLNRFSSINKKMSENTKILYDITFISLSK